MRYEDPFLSPNRGRIMSKYVNPYTDFGFKKLFGEEANKDLLMDFLMRWTPSTVQLEG